MNFSRIQPLFPITLSALFFSLAMNYPEQAWIFIFFFLTPLLLHAEKVSKKPSPKNLFHSYTSIFLFGCLSLFLSTFWFASTFPLDWMHIADPTLNILIIGGLWLGFVLALSIPIAFFGVITLLLRTNNTIIRAFFAACAWAALEHVRSWFVALSVYGSETLFGPHHTYYALAYTLPHVPLLKELLPVGGLPLGTFVIILINYAVFLCIKKAVHPQEKKHVFFLILSIVIIITSSVFVMHSIRGNNNNEQAVPISLINSTFPSLITKEGQQEKARVAYDFLTNMNHSTSLIIFPENFSLLPEYLEKGDAPWLHSVIISSFSGQHFYNMFFLNTKNTSMSYSRKQLLMPIGEYSVFWIRKLLQLTRNKEWLGLYDANNHTAKKSSNRYLFSDPLLGTVVIGGSLCSENISPILHREMVRGGATLLVNIASQIPFHDSALLSRQTLAINTTRALENGRYFITASNMSRSFVVSDVGEIQNISPPFADRISVIDTTVQTKSYQTPYVRYGDYVSYTSLIIIFLALIWCRKTPATL